MVIAVELQAHGHSRDVDRPLTYDQMAADTLTLLRQLKIDDANFYGYSMGGGVALQIAIARPDIVRRLIFAGGASYGPDGLYPAFHEGVETMKLEDLAGSIWHQAYLKVAPDPDGWPCLVAKVRERDLTFEGWPPKDIQNVKAPTLLIIGDSDIVRPEHAVQMFRLLGGGVPGDLLPLPASQLAVLPGTSHVGLLNRTLWLHSMITTFLDDPRRDPS